MIEEIEKRLAGVGLYPLIAAGAAVVIVVFALVAYFGSQRTTPNTGLDSGPVALSSASAGASASASASSSSRAPASATATPHSAPTTLGPGPTSLAPPPAGAVLVDKNAPAGLATWQSQTFTAPSAWSISYTYNCGGNGGHFIVAVFSDLTQDSPIDKHGDTGSGTVTIHGGGTGYYIATDTTKDCAWHVTARA